MKRQLSIATTILAALALAGVTSRAANETTVGKIASSDISFVREASASGKEEVEFGRLLTEKATSQDLKDFGKKIMDDHSQANDKLSRIASQKGIELAAEPTLGERHELQKLEKLSGEKFDAAARDYAIKDHNADIKRFEAAQKNLQDPDLKQFVQQTLPVLQDHLRMAEQLKTGVR